jgi:hypothetical protein
MRDTLITGTILALFIVDYIIYKTKKNVTKLIKNQ